MHARVPYVSAIGSLTYVMVCTRPDLAQTASIVSSIRVNLGRNIDKQLNEYSSTLRVQLILDSSTKVTHLVHLLVI